MCLGISYNLFDVPNIKNRVWETDKLSNKGLMVLRIGGFIILLEINIMCVILFAWVNSLKFFGLTYITIMFSLITYGLLLIDLVTNTTWVWKLGHLLYEIFMSFCVALTVVFIAVIICSSLSVDSGDIAGLEDGWIELIIKVQLYTVVLALYLVDFYTNRIECCLRHMAVIIFVMVLIVGLYIGISKIDDSIDDFVHWDNPGSIGYLLSIAVLVVAVFCFTIMLSNKKQFRYGLKNPSSISNKADKAAVHLSIDRI